MEKTYQGTVYSWNCDHMGHMNVMYYINMFDQASWNVFTTIGLSAKYLKENHRGMAALEQQIQYKREVLAGDSIYIESEILEAKKKIMKMRHVMKNVADDGIVAETTITSCHIDTLKRKGTLLPEFVLEKINLK